MVYLGKKKAARFLKPHSLIKSTMGLCVFCLPHEQMMINNLGPVHGKTREKRNNPQRPQNPLKFFYQLNRPMATCQVKKIFIPLDFL